MKKILLATLLLANLEAQELATYLDECQPMDDMRCVDMKELSSQAMSLFQQQKFPQAIEKFKRVMTMAEKERLEPSNFYNNLGLAYNNIKEYDNALKYFRKNVEYERGKGAKRNKVLLSIVYGNMGLAYMGKKEFSQAIEVAQKSLDIVYELKDKPKIAQRERKIGLIYQLNKEHDKAIEHYEKAFEFDVDKLEHSVLVKAYIEVAQTWQNKKDYDKAIKYFERIRKKSIEIVGEEHPQTAMIYAYMGASYIEQKRYKKAKEFLLRALKIYKKTGTNRNPLIEAMLTNLKYIDKHFITIYNNKIPEGKYGEQRKKAEAFVQDFVKYYNNNDDSLLLESFKKFKNLSYMEIMTEPSFIKEMFVKMRKEWGDMKSHKYMGAILTRAMVKIEVSPDKSERQVFHRLVYHTKFERGTTVAMQFYFMFRPDGTMFFQRMKGTDASVVYDVQ